MTRSEPTTIGSRVGQLVIDRALGEHGSGVPPRARRLALSLSRRAFGRRDPVVRRRVGNVEIALPLSHRLPDYLACYPMYGQNLVRLASFLDSGPDDLRVIDVGANVGDTAALLRTVTSAPILCVEADPRYFELLVANVRHLEQVTCVQEYLGRRPQTVRGAIERREGTGHLVTASTEVTITTLDELIQRHPDFAGTSLVKIDVDGLDFEILGGAERLLAEAMPVLFVEYDPTLVRAQGFCARTALDRLGELGYEGFVAYDNLGHLALVNSLTNHELLDDLDAYVAGMQSRMFLDLAIFHASDEPRFRAFVAAERTHRSRTNCDPLQN